MNIKRRRYAAPVVVTAVVTVAAFAFWALGTRPSSPPRYTDARPEPKESELVGVTHSILIDASQEEVYAWANDPDRELGDLVQSGGGVPEVIGTEIIWGSWKPGTRAGDRRRVAFADGNFLAEEVLADSSDRFRYQIWGFTGPQRFAITYGVAEFRYLSEGDQTRLTWTYALRPTSVVLRPVVWAFLSRSVSPMMERTLAVIKNGVE